MGLSLAEFLKGAAGGKFSPGYLLVGNELLSFGWRPFGRCLGGAFHEEQVGWKRTVLTRIPVVHPVADGNSEYQDRRCKAPLRPRAL